MSKSQDTKKSAKKKPQKTAKEKKLAKKEKKKNGQPGNSLSTASLLQRVNLRECKTMMSWIEEHWPKSTIFLAVYSTILIFLFVLKIDIALFLIWIQLPVYWLHQFEEYVFPGGFIETFNRQILGSNEKEWPMSKRASFWINIPIIYIAFPLSAIMAGTIDISIGIWTAYFSILNATSHVGMFVKKKEI